MFPLQQWAQRIALVLFGSLLWVSLAQAQPVFQHLKAFNVSTLFDGSANSAGEGVIDVAYDGYSAYLAGFRAATGTGTVGVVRLDDVLNLPSGSITSSTPGVNRIISLVQQGSGRDTRLRYYSGSLYLATGLGDGNAANTGIRKYDTNGQLDTSWAGDGLLSLSEAGFARYDTIAIDPGYGGSGPSLAVGSLSTGSSQPIKRFSLTTGELLGASNNVAPTFLRDIAYAPNGDLYLVRASNDANDGVFSAERTGVDSYGSLSSIVGVDLGNYAQHKVNYVPMSQAFPGSKDLLAFNERVGAVEARKLFLSTLDGTIVAEIDGSGPTVDGVDLGTFGHNLINSFPYVTSDGKLYLFVVSGHVGGSPAGTIDRLDVYLAVPEPSSLAVLGLGISALIWRRRKKA